MSYTALYRRFRPQLFSELVGQEHISKTLSAAIRERCFVHAYLFAGPRGTGKTSTARIMARAVNCLNPTEAGEPCGVCPACTRSLTGEALDILEIDAASNRGIDEIRDLRERVKYAPAMERYKVYIIDEVHMLTAPAFNALLKTLEEPPPHVLFVLATTEPHKMPLTVLSRCQRFDFRRVGEAEAAAHLAQVAQAEGFDADAEALTLIARRAEGGMRDSLSLLDQCASVGGGRVTVAALNQLTGAVDADFIATLTERLLAGDAAALLNMVAELHAEGHDLRQFLCELLEYQRELLLTKLSPSEQPSSSLKLTPGEQALPAWAAAASPAQLIKVMQTLADSDGRLRNSLQPRVTLELVLLSACGIMEDVKQQAAQPTAQPVSRRAPSGENKGRPDEEGKTPPVKRPLGKATPPREQASPPERQAPPPPEQAPPPPEQAPPPERHDTPPPRTPVNAPTPAPPPAPAPDNELNRLRELWPQIIQAVGQSNNSTGAFLAGSQPLELRGDHLTIRFGAAYALFMNNVCRPGPARELTEQTITRHFGRALIIEGLLAQAEDEPPPPDEAPPQREQGSLF